MTDYKKNELIERVEVEINENFSTAEANNLIQLAHLYFQDSLTEDLVNESIENLYGTIICLWDFLQQRPVNQPKVRVYNPNYEEHSWQSTHTVIEILTDDMPFLVSSFNMALVRLGHTIHLTAHPVVPVDRNKKGELQGINSSSKSHEALMRFEIDRLSDINLLDEIKEELLNSLVDVKKTVADWPTMKAKLSDIISESEQLAHLKKNEEHQEILDFLRWVANDHFTFIGFRAYDLAIEGDETHLKLVEGSGLGTFRDINDKKVKRDIVLQDNLAKLAVDPSNILVLTKSTAVSTVHRPVHLDYLGVKRFDKKGNVIGEWRFFGLYSSAAYIARLQDIPLLRKKLNVIVEKANVDPNSHKGKNLKHILNSYPRDEMLQAPVDELFGTIESILAIQERRQLRVFLRKDIYGRFLNALVYVPRDRYNTELRMKMQDILMSACNGTSSEFNVQFSQLVLARVNFTIQIADPKQSPTIDAEDIQRKMQDAMSSWEDKLLTALHKSHGEENGNILIKINISVHADGKLNYPSVCCTVTILV